MAELTLESSAPAETIVATGISGEAYLAQYAETFHEWVQGEVFKISPASLQHMVIVKYLLHLLDIYMELNPIGTVIAASFVMHLEAISAYREPDLQVILKNNPGQLTDTAMIGPADICIEVVSPESISRDYGKKFEEYEKAGVREYWIIDPLRQRCDFNRRELTRLYSRIAPDASGNYQSPLLPKLMLNVPTLWRDPMPGALATAQAVQQMLS